MLHITEHQPPTKMEGVTSINTSTLANEFCQGRAEIKNSVCSKCYAGRTEKMRHTMQAKFEGNGDILSSVLIDDGYLYKLENRRFLRFHSFGEIINETHLSNFFQIAEDNPHVLCTLYTKRFPLVTNELMRRSKPDNLILIASSLFLNRPVALPEGFDKVFTVYTADYIKKHEDLVINCNKKCINCRLCYTKNSIININEKAK